MDYTKLYKKIDRWCWKNLPLKRYLHALRVTKYAQKLAKRNNVDKEKVKIAGIAHDVARYWSRQEMRQYIEESGHKWLDEEIQYPYTLHGLCGSIMLKKKWNCKDRDIHNAVRYHTTGRKGMSLLEKIIFIADYMEPGRKHVSKKLRRKTKKKELDTILQKVVKEMLIYEKEQKRVTHPRTIEMAKELGLQ